MESVELKHQDSEPEQKSWIEREFEKRECACFIPSSKERQRCGCGRLRDEHLYLEDEPHNHGHMTSDEKWCPSLHTTISSTDAYGTVEFQGGPQPTKAQYVRLSYDTKPDQVLQLLQKQWNLELPKLLISVHGGIANFELQPKLRRVFRKGLLKAAKTTGAWIVSAGINTGVVRHVGDALGDTLVQARNHIVTLGIAPWGVVHNRTDLLGLDIVTPYHSVAAHHANSVVLNSNHSYFILVDNGTAGKYGCEFMLRKKLEKHIQQQKLTTRSEAKKHSTPVVSLILEGGTNTIRTVLECITDTPPVPVVVCDGSGRAADLLAFTHKYAQDDGTMPETLRDQLIQTIEKTFQYNREQAEKLFIELMLCVKKKELITVFRMGEESQDIDLAILTALLKAQTSTSADQLSLALTWNRVDIARSHIFVYGQVWPEGALDQAMMDALVYDRVDFVELLLQNGVSMQKWLTIARLEELFNIKQDPGCTLRYLVKHAHGYYSLYDIGLVIEQLMGGAYQASFCRKHFKKMYNCVMKRSCTNASLSGAVSNHVDSSTYSAPPIQVFRYPYHELMVWAVLLKRQNMAKFMWQHGEEALAKALVACKLHKSMAREAAQDDLEIDISEEFKGHANEFAQLALDLLEQCYKNDDDLTPQLLTYELDHWSDQTCLSLAVSANHRELIAHTCCQIQLTEMWMGALRMRKYTGFKVVLGILFFPFLFCLEFKSKEELQLMPQTVEEHMQEIDDSDTDSDDSSVSSRDPSVCSSQHTPNTIKYSTPNGTALLNDIGNSIKESSKKSSLRFGKKIYEFYTAPITKFYMHTMGYLAFLMLLTYTVLIKMGPLPSWQEWYVIAYMLTFFMEKVRELIASEPKRLLTKLYMFYSEVWNITDTIAIILFAVGVLLRFCPVLLGYGKVLYCMDIVFWYVRLLDIMSVSKSLGPYVTMIGKMMKDLMNFVVILLIVLMAFGIVRQAITYPDEEPNWHLAKYIFLKPYFMLYGEVYAPEIDPDCGEDKEYKCVPGRWFVPAAMTAFLIVANILLLNLLIAVFNNTFHQVNRISKQVWKFQRYLLVIEYEGKPILPPPFILLCHVYMLFRFIIRRCMHKGYHFDNGLKLFLEEDEVEKLHDFEEEAMQDLYRMKGVMYRSSADERIRVTTERVENMSLRMDDINQKENAMRLSLQTLDYRMAKLEELTVQGLDSMSKLHQAMLQIQRGPSNHNHRKRRDRSDSTTKPLYIHIPSQRSPIFEPFNPAQSLMKRRKHRKNEDRLRPFTDYSKPNSRPHFMKSQSWEGGVMLDAEKPRPSTVLKSDRVRSVKFNDNVVENGTKSPHAGSNDLDFPNYKKPNFSFNAYVPCRKQNDEREGNIMINGFTEDAIGPVSDPCERSNATTCMPPVRSCCNHINDSNLADQHEPPPLPAVTSSNPHHSNSSHNNVSSGGQFASQGMSLITTTRSEYTSITDDIDTTCLKYPSPGGSPITPHKSFLDFYIPSNDKDRSDMLGMTKTFQLSEAEQLKNAEESEHAQMEPMIRKRMRHISLTEADSLGDIAKHVVNELTTSSDSSDSSTSSQQSVYSENDGAIEFPPATVKKKGLKHVKSEPAFHLQQVKVHDLKNTEKGQTATIETNGPVLKESESQEAEMTVKKKRVSYLADIVESVA